jgi:hypothetical protein
MKRHKFNAAMSILIVLLLLGMISIALNSGSPNVAIVPGIFAFLVVVGSIQEAITRPPSHE